MTAPGVFEFPIQVRYMEVDAQNVVFNAWYLTYFDEAFSAFMAARGWPYEKMIEAGFDVQLVHTDIDWQAGLRWPDQVRVAVATARVGTTSFALDFQTRLDGTPTCSARTVYVVVGTDGSGKRPLPPQLVAALGPPAPLRDS
jgi:acyl-CoA thioester hydrolase